jgi:hypothetical protein
VRFQGGLYVPKIQFEAHHDRSLSQAELIEQYRRAASQGRLGPVVEDKTRIRLADGTYVLFHQNNRASWWVDASDWHLKPPAMPSKEWLERLASLVLNIAESPGLESVVVLRDSGFGVEPSPLIARRAHVVATTDKQVEACYADPAVFWSAWDHVEMLGTVKVCMRALDAIDELSWLRRTFESSMAMWRAARRSGTDFGTLTVSEVEGAGEALRPWTSGDESLAVHHYDAESGSLELRFTGECEHVTMADIRRVRRAANGRDDEGRAVARVVVGFPDETTARREARPLLDLRARVIFEGGEIVNEPSVPRAGRARPSPGRGVRVDGVPYSKEDVLRLRLGGGDIRLSFNLHEPSILAPSRSDGGRFVAELARQLGISFSPDHDGPAPARSKVETVYGGYEQHPTLGKMWRLEVRLGGTRRNPVGFELWRHRDASWFLLDHIEPSAEVVVRRLGELLVPSRPAGESSAPFASAPELLAERLGPYAWSCDDSLWASMPEQSSCAIVRWPATSSTASAIATVPGAVNLVLPSPTGEWLAISTCVGAPAPDGTHSSAQPHEIWLVSPAGAARKLAESAEEPFGIVWSPSGDRLAIGGVYGVPSLRLFAASSGTLLEDIKPSASSLSVWGWTNEGVIASGQLPGGDEDRQLVYQPGADRSWRVVDRVWWPSPCGRTEVSIDGQTLHARGEVFGSQSIADADARGLDATARSGPIWCGPRHVLIGERVLGMTSREMMRITDETGEAHHVVANNDGTLIVWRDALHRVWRARTRAGS